MASEDWLAGIGGGLQGGLGGFTWAKEFDQKDRQIESQREIARLRDEIRLMLAQIGAGSREKIADANIGSREKIAGANIDSRESITGANIDSREKIAGQRDTTTRRGQDITQQLGIGRDTTTRRGQDFQFDLGVMRDTTARRGQDVGATTTRRGQDLTRTTATEAEGGRNTRATDANRLREQEIEARTERDRARRRDPWSGVDLGGDTPITEIREETGTGKPTAQPIEVKETTGGLPVAPRSPEAAADQSQRLEQQALSIIERFKVEKDPARREALRNDLKRLREQIVQAQQKSGGGR
jgi:hypothetical protein